MTSKERILKAFSNTGQPDRVPFETGMDFDTLTCLSSLDYWEYKEQGRTELSELLSWQEKLGFDLYYFTGAVPRANSPESVQISTVESQQDDVRIIEMNVSTSHGKIQQRHQIPRYGPEYAPEKFIKDIDKDWPALKEFYGQNWKIDKSYFDVYERIGDKGVTGVVINTPIDFWLGARNGGAEQMIYDIFDDQKIMQEFYEYYFFNSFEYLRAVSKLDPKPDFVMIHGSSCSASLISPEIFKTYALPFIQEVASFLKDVGILSLLHVCGKSNNWLPMIADTDINVMDALEHPPAGNVDLGEAKKLYGDKLCLKGNVSAIVMANGTPAQVRQEVKQCIDAAAEGGGFMLAVGDSIGPKVKQENVEEFAAAALEYGKY